MVIFQIAPPNKFNFAQASEWPRWLRRFERFHVASGLIDKDEDNKVNTLVYTMGEEADEIFSS